MLNRLGRRLDEAQACFEQALRLRPDSALVLNNLGAVLLAKANQSEQAMHCFRRVLALEPQSASAHNNLGIALQLLGQLDASEQSLRQAFALQPDLADAHRNLGGLLRDRGRLDEALACFEKLLTLAPGSVDAHTLLLFTLDYHPELSSEQIYAAFRRYDQLMGLPWRTQWRAHDGNDRTLGRRLRVGYVAATFYQHSCGYFLEPLLAQHDKAAVEVFLYAHQTQNDELTLRYQGYADHWVDSECLSDEALAERIRADRIDVLVDINGQTAGNRLTVFARKPAPVSLHWLDFGYTTGLSAIDYYLSDWPSVPAGSEALFSETPWRLDGPALAYRPHPDMGQVSPLPALSNGYVTFGTLTRSVRINHRTLRVWSQILQRVPNSKLLIDSHDFRHAAMQDDLAERFAKHGIGRERLLIGYHSPPWDTLRSIDIALDCFPHNSGTTLLESLYMGLPFVTLAGRPSVGTLGSAILTGLGRTDWVAHSEDEYTTIAVALAADWPQLVAIRASLRAAMQSSPLMDEVGFARRVEAAYRQMFALWAQRPQSEPAAALAASQPAAGAPALWPELPTPSQIEAMLQSGQAAAAQQQLQQITASLMAQQQLPQAQAMARLITANFPNDVFGWRVLGGVLNQQGLAAQALLPL
ncbi:MAG: tetratricopeptide repeat protein [Rhodoferax sp.]|nr:tetratricopeptide repeat protein [Rhodoferax sp.]